jgi:hypothetical protein
MTIPLLQGAAVLAPALARAFHAAGPWLADQIHHHPVEWLGALLGISGSYVLAENAPWSRYGWVIWIGSNVLLISYFLSIGSWGVLAMQVFYLHSSYRGCRRAFSRGIQ